MIHAALLTIVISVFGCPTGYAFQGDSSSVYWKGILRDGSGRAIDGARLRLKRRSTAEVIEAASGAGGVFVFERLAPDSYSLSAEWQGRTVNAAAALELTAGARLDIGLRITGESQLVLDRVPEKSAQAASGGEQLSSRDVSNLPLNKRDFGQLLLLAAGTMTDVNGSVNFTRQYAVNGQRGTAATFAMDGVDTSDPELGGATFSNFNVDAIERLQSSSGVLPPEIGRGAAAYTNVITKSGGPRLHGTAFEFLRNAALDARNYFDRRSIANPGRIPPFARNEFGVTVGGPVELPGIYKSRNRTFFFGQYQGFRQVLGTTQVLPVPTPEERQGKNTTAFPGDTLYVPVDPKIAQVLARYPLPNDLNGAFGARTYATSSKVATVTDQFSARIDHRTSAKGQLFTRFTLNQVDGPIVNPNQTAIDPDFAMRFLDHQRNVGISYTRTPSARFISETVLGFERSTPSYPTTNRTQPALRFADGVYETFNSAAGAITSIYGNVFQARQNFVWILGTHTFKAGAEVRVNRDTSIYATNVNGAYMFAAGGAVSPVAIRSASGMHNIDPGARLPDALSGFLTATPYSYSITLAPPGFPSGDRIGEVAIRREAYNFFFQDTWKIAPRFSLSYGLRYELNTPMRDGKSRTSGLVFRGATPEFLVNLKPSYDMDWGGWGPRLGLTWSLDSHTQFRAGGAISTILPNPGQDNFVMGGVPFVTPLYLAAAPGSPVLFDPVTTHMSLPQAYTPDGRLIFQPGQASTSVPSNIPMDVERFERDLAALTPDHRVRGVTTSGMVSDFRNGYIGTWSAGLSREIREVRINASYTGTAGNGLVRLDYPNGYAAAQPAYAPYTQFDAAGRMAGGYGPQYFITNGSHSSFHSLQVVVGKYSLRNGPGFQASYTFSKSLDDTSTVLQVAPQDPRNPRAEKGPSSF
ncbi:MAG: TonB-dependent receptor, partial [Acidobacteria bacterium]|nr:TonB-dependent receptor [Acidobacteriota bacterium]